MMNMVEIPISTSTRQSCESIARYIPNLSMGAMSLRSIFPPPYQRRPGADLNRLFEPTLFIGPLAMDPEMRGVV